MELIRLNRFQKVLTMIESTSFSNARIIIFGGPGAQRRSIVKGPCYEQRAVIVMMIIVWSSMLLLITSAVEG